MYFSKWDDEVINRIFLTFKLLRLTVDYFSVHVIYINIM